jgi:hypothetical protein
LLLAPLEVFPQRRRQPRAPRRPFLGFAGFDHGHLKACLLWRGNNALEASLRAQKAALIASTAPCSCWYLVKDRRPPEAAALRAVLDKITNTNNQHPSDQGRPSVR